MTKNSNQGGFCLKTFVSENSDFMSNDWLVWEFEEEMCVMCTPEAKKAVRDFF